MRNIKLKGLVIVTTLSAVLLTGCTTHDDLIINDPRPNVEQQTFEPVIPNNQVEESKPIDSLESSQEIQSAQEFTFFSDAKKELTEYIESDDFQKLKEKGKYYVTTGIDFIFFDKEINGITFDQMSTEFKIRVMNDVAALDNAVEAYFPGYKESFSSKYQIAAEFVSSKYLDMVDVIKEYLGEDNWNALGNMKDKIWGDLTTTKDQAIEDIKELYKSWRDK
jgi:hypothetical protein